MKISRAFLVIALLGAGRLVAQSDDSGLSAQRLNLLDHHGYFTANFKDAVHNLVDARQALAETVAEEKKFREDLPALHQQGAAEIARTESLRKELALYAHPEDGDFDALQAAMKDSAATPAQRLALVQAFVWSYPSDPRQTEAEQDLRLIQGQIATRQQAGLDSATAASAARAALVQRAREGRLTLAEWQNFLRDMSQEEVLSYLGPAQDQQTDYWNYSGNRTIDPATKKSASLHIIFNGTRVLSVVPNPP